MGPWQLLRKAKELWSWYSFAVGATALAAGIGAVVIAWLSTTWAWYWQTFSWAGVAFAFLVAWLVIAVGVFLIGIGVSKWRGGARSEVPVRPLPPSDLTRGLYVGDIRLTFGDLEKDRHTEITISIFNGTGRVIEFSNLFGKIKFNAPNNSDPAKMGELPAPAMRSDTARSVRQFDEWFIMLTQRVPAPDADKILAMLQADVPIHFDLSGLTVHVFASNDPRNIVPLPLWHGISYSKGFGFGRVLSVSARITIGANTTIR